MKPPPRQSDRNLDAREHGILSQRGLQDYVVYTHRQTDHPQNNITKA